MTSMLYIDNIRGFDKTLIPIKDVNFFVGENSTGKTTILSLIALLGSSLFWVNQSFNTEEHQLGTYKDIASLSNNSKDSEFYIGYIEVNDKKNEAILMTFNEFENYPHLLRYHHICSKGQVIFHFKKKQIRYNFIPKPKDAKDLDVHEIFIKTICDKNDYKSYKYNLLNSDLFIDNHDFLLRVNNILNVIYNQPIYTRKSFFNMNLPEFASKLIFIAPIRSKPKKTYDEFKLDFDSAGSHTPYLMRKMLKQRNISLAFKEFLDKFGANSGLFDGISIKKYGKELTSPFQLQANINELSLPINNIGYGVSQSLPIIVELFARPQNFKYAIQQPEVHLHPRAQAALGDVIYLLSTEENKKFFIETHSDYLIDRYRLNLKKNTNNHNLSSQILFFQKTSTGNRITPIPISNTGEISDDQPKEFREFFIHEQLALLGF